MSFTLCQFLLCGSLPGVFYFLHGFGFALTNSILVIHPTSYYPFQVGSRLSDRLKKLNANLPQKSVTSSLPSDTKLLWVENIQNVNRGKTPQKVGRTLGPVLKTSSSENIALGVGFNLKIQEHDVRSQTQGRFSSPTTACSERHEPRGFNCQPSNLNVAQDRTVDPNPTQHWQKGVSFLLPRKRSSALLASRPSSAPQMLPRHPCNSILCPIGGNVGYGYTGLEEKRVTTAQVQHHLYDRNCTSLLCTLSNIKRNDNNVHMPNYTTA